MIVLVDSTVRPAEVRLDEAADFRRFHVEVRGPAGSLDVDRILRNSDVGRAEGDEAFISPEALRRLAGGVASPDWLDGLRSMTGFARDKGWVDEGGWIQAHVERDTAS